VSPGRTPRQRLVAAAALALVGAAALGSSIALKGRPLIAVSDANRTVNPGARDAGDIRANNSPGLAQNPRRASNLAVVNRIDTPDYSCALQVSQDRGARWSRVPVPIPPGAGRKCYAPDVTFGADGTLYVSYVTLRGNANSPGAVWVARSVDGGRTLSAPRRVSGPLAFQVRLTADPKRSKRLYLTWLQPADVGLFLFAGGPNRIVVARSDDGGRNWQPPVQASEPRRERVLAPSPAVGPDGALYVLYLDVGGDRLDYNGGHNGLGGAPYDGRFALVLARSSDGGATWGESVVDDRVAPTRRFLAFLPPSPSLAVDPRDGRIFAAFEDGSRSPSDVHVWTLPPGADRWDGPTRVNDTPAGDRTSQYLPKIGVAPDGRLDVAYYDRRDDPANRRNTVSVQSSFDAGRSFTAHVTVTDRSFDSRIGAGSERGLPDLGSRLGLASTSSGMFAAWSDTRAGSVGSNKQDIAFAEAAVTRAEPPARHWLRFGGTAALLAGGLLLFSLARPRAD